MKTRREFIKTAALGAAALTAGNASRLIASTGPVRKPLVVSTWSFGMPANVAAWEKLASGERALDAIETGVRVCEGDPEVRTVGYGGYPDRDGYVTLDSCIMDETGNAGSVAFLQHIKHPVSVARKVMEETPHVMLVGEGALRFALDQGFEKENLLTPKAEASWKQWLKDGGHYEPIRPDQADHDTISMLAIDQAGDLSGCCTTSGLSYKMHGRVGDSPIIGAALFVDNEVGGACATGVGEAVIKTVGSFLVVELMRQGLSPQEACKAAVERIVNRYPEYRKVQVGFLAINKRGEAGAFAIGKGFQYAVHDETGNVLVDAEFLLS